MKSSILPRGYAAIWSMYGAGRMEPPGQHLDNSAALAAFIARKADIDTILGRLGSLNAEHFNRAPDDISWGDVGTLGSYLEGLRDINDAAFYEGEYAA